MRITTTPNCQARPTMSICEKVGDVVQAVADELSEWAEARGAGFFSGPTLLHSPTWPQSAHGPQANAMNPLR
jgi:hypothetical protein